MAEMNTKEKIELLIELMKKAIKTTITLSEGEINLIPEVEVIKMLEFKENFKPVQLWQEMATWCYAELLKRKIVLLNGSKFDEKRLEREKQEIAKKLLKIYEFLERKRTKIKK